MNATTDLSRLGLDDTLHAVVQLSHEHDLPLHGVYVSAGQVMVSCERADIVDWTRWLAAVGEPRVVAWLDDTHRAVSVSALAEILAGGAA